MTIVFLVGTCREFACGFGAIILLVFKLFSIRPYMAERACLENVGLVDLMKIMKMNFTIQLHMVTRVC